MSAPRPLRRSKRAPPSNSKLARCIRFSFLPPTDRISHPIWGAPLRMVDRHLYHSKRAPPSNAQISCKPCFSYPSSCAMPVFHLAHSILFPLLPAQITQYLKRRTPSGHPWSNTKTVATNRTSPFLGRVPTTFRAPLSPLAYRRHELPPLVDRRRFTLPPGPLMMLMMHDWPSITPLASQHPKSHTRSIPFESSLFSFSPTRLWARPPNLTRVRTPPHTHTHTLYSLRSPNPTPA